MSANTDKVDMNKDLLEIKNQIRKPVKKSFQRDEADQITSQLKDLMADVDEIKKKLIGEKKSYTKLKKKKEVIYLLKKKEEITTSQLAEKIDLSRTRCSEYLNELKREGVVDCEKRGRSKYYKLSV